VKYEQSTRTYEKCLLLEEHQPGIQLNYVTEEQLREMPDEDQQLYAEITYSWLITRINQIKRNYRIDYLFCVLTDEPYDSQFFLFSAADEGAVRGTNYEEVYTLGTISEVSGSQQDAMRDAVRNLSNLADAGKYVDYYSFLCNIDGHDVLIGMTYNLSMIRADIRSRTWQGGTFAMISQLFLSVLCLLMIYYFVIRPLKTVQYNIRLYKNTKESSQVIDNLAGVSPPNEIGELSEDVSSLVREIDDHLDKIRTITSEKERIGAELSLATNIQESILPNIFPPFPDRKDFNIYASMNPAREVGGDFYDFFLTDEDHLGIIIADVSGKGIPAALYMMASKIILKSNAMMKKTPAQILTGANRGICDQNQVEMFVTAWVGILELSTGRLVAANAGHEYPVIRHKNGIYEMLKDKHGLVLGGMTGINYSEYEIILEPGAKLFLYTDGIPEATNAEGKMFGTDCMLIALNESAHADPKTTIENMRAAVDGFVKDAEQFDDLTMLCLEYLGGCGNEED